MEPKRSLVQIVGESIAVGGVSYPIVSGLYALFSDVTFLEKLKDPSTTGVAIGVAGGYFISQSVRELHHRYKIVKREQS